MQTSNFEAPHFWRPCSSAQVARPWIRAWLQLQIYKLQLQIYKLQLYIFKLQL
jgi:hypothetical protein